MRVLVAAALAVASACSGPEPEPLVLDGNLLTVNNRTSADWNDVEIWINSYFRATVKSIPAGGRFQAPLDVFVSGYGQRFDFHRMQIRDLRLTGTRSSGEPLLVTKQFQAGGLAGALGGKR
jgi:hypothetical protein